MTISELAGKRVTLVPMRLEEADLVAKWVSEPSVQARWFGKAASRHEVLERWPPVFFDDAFPQKGRMFRIDEGGAPVGGVAHGVVFGAPRNVMVELLLTPSASAETGADAVRALGPYLFESLLVHKAWAEVPPDQVREVASFEQAGYARAGFTAEGGRAILQRERPEAGRRASRSAGTLGPSV
jgi:RimJ/RimL family protein N-acetyltransferase